MGSGAPGIHQGRSLLPRLLGLLGRPALASGVMAARSSASPIFDEPWTPELVCLPHVMQLPVAFHAIAGTQRVGAGRGNVTIRTRT